MKIISERGSYCCKWRCSLCRF